MSTEHNNTISDDPLLSKLNASNLKNPAIVLGCLAICAIALFFYILAEAIFSKLDLNSEYSIQASTRVVSFIPNDSLNPIATFATFRLLRRLADCPRLNTNEWYSTGELKLYPNSMVSMRRTSKELIQLNVEPLSDTQKSSELISKRGRCALSEKLSIDIRLDEAQPEFLMIMVGQITIGKPLSFDTRNPNMMLNEGSIEVRDKSFWFSDPIKLAELSLNSGDTVKLMSDKSNAAKGLVTANLDDMAMQGVFNKKGGLVQIIRPFASNDGETLHISFFERLYHDNALAIALSISFIVIQVLMFLITTLIRLSYIPKPTQIQKSNKLEQQEDLEEKDISNEKTI